MFGLRLPELLIILVIVVVIFGVGRLPELGSGLGKGIREFRKAIGGGDGDASKKEEKASGNGSPGSQKT